MTKRFSTFLSVGLLSLALTAGAQAQPATDDGAVTTRSASPADDDDRDDDEGFSMGWLGLLGLLGLAGLIPTKTRDADRDRLLRQDSATTKTRT